MGPTDTLQVGGRTLGCGLTSAPQVPSMAQSRTMVRAASASASSPPHHSAMNTKFKRGRLLQRQQCQEGEGQEDKEPDKPSVTKSEPPPSPPPTTSALVKQHSSPILPYNSPPRSSPPPPPKEVLPPPPLKSPDPPPKEPPEPKPSLPDRQPSLDPLCGLESVPLLYSR